MLYVTIEKMVSAKDGEIIENVGCFYTADEYKNLVNKMF